MAICVIEVVPRSISVVWSDDGDFHPVLIGVDPSLDLRESLRPTVAEVCGLRISSESLILDSWNWGCSLIYTGRANYNVTIDILPASGLKHVQIENRISVEHVSLMPNIIPDPGNLSGQIEHNVDSVAGLFAGVAVKEVASPEVCLKPCELQLRTALKIVQDSDSRPSSITTLADMNPDKSNSTSNQYTRHSPQLFMFPFHRGIILRT